VSIWSSGSVDKASSCAFCLAVKCLEVSLFIDSPFILCSSTVANYPPNFFIILCFINRPSVNHKNDYLTDNPNRFSALFIRISSHFSLNWRSKSSSISFSFKVAIAKRISPFHWMIYLFKCFNAFICEINQIFKMYHRTHRASFHH
jgi:hypothetical protein